MTPLARYLPPRVTEARLARQYGHVKARLKPTRPHRRVAPFALAAAAVFALILVFRFALRPSPVAVLSDGTVLESGAEGTGPAVTLLDGSRVTLGGESRVRLASTRAEAIRVEVDRGRVDVAATHVAGRSFVVAAGPYEVKVVGTRFAVERPDDGRVRVTVTEGRVQVVGARGEAAFVGAGETWTAPAATSEEAAPADDLDEDEPAASDAPRRAGPTRHADRAADAKELLENAQKATAEGRTRDAAQLYDTLRRKYRRDARAGLAALELGRLRLDVLGDPGGAEEAFRDAARLAKSGSVREDAEARRVEALDKMGSRAACVTARDAYLARYAQGVHRAEVTARCGGH